MASCARAAFGVLAVAVGLAGCTSTQSPVLYPNAHLQQVGQEQAERDVAACRELADQNVPSAAGKEIAKDTAIGAVGGATGGTAGAVHGAAKQTGPSPVYKNFVNRCLREKGYDVIGWQ